MYKDVDDGELKRRVFKVTRRDNPKEVAIFRYEDNKWPLIDLLRPHERPGEATVNFSTVEEWLRDDTKEYIAHLWLETKTYPNAIQQTMTAIRSLGRILPEFKGRPIDLRMRQAREFVRSFANRGMSPSYNQRVRDILNPFMAFVRNQHPEEKRNNFKIVFPESVVRIDVKTPLGTSPSATVSIETEAAIIDACVAEVDAYYEAKKTYIDSIEDHRTYNTQYARERRERLRQGLPARIGQKPKLHELLSRAIKSQAVILEICVGRRIAAVCNTKFDVRAKKIDLVDKGGHKKRGVMIRFREMKIRNIYEDVYCPETYGEIALKAIKTVRELTAELRRDNPEWAEYLFLIPALKRKRALVLCPSQINHYLNCEAKITGLLERYQIPGGPIKTHSFRRTRATKAWKGGLRVDKIAFDLGHAGPDMTIKHYISGEDESRRRFQSHMDRGPLRGAMENLVRKGDQ